MTVQKERVITRYEPFAEAEHHHGEWTIELIDLHGLGEIFDLASRTVLIDPSYAGRRYAVAHVLAHLDLGHVSTRYDCFSTQQEADAHFLATVRLDEEGSRECA